MLIVHQFALYLHIIIGAIALIVFWVPVVTVKAAHSIDYGEKYLLGVCG